MQYFKILLISLFLFVLTVSAQVSPKNTKVEDDGEILKVETQLVDVPIVITNQDGKPILNLKSENFDIFEDGKKQELSAFTTTNAPFEVALLLDTSGSTRSELR
ncbi:MAG: hypothetical protein ACR2MD_16370, partial [Aridibacter sp.]